MKAELKVLYQIYNWLWTGSIHSGCTGIKTADSMASEAAAAAACVISVSSCKYLHGAIAGQQSLTADCKQSNWAVKQPASTCPLALGLSSAPGLGSCAWGWLPVWQWPTGHLPPHFLGRSGSTDSGLPAVTRKRRSRRASAVQTTAVANLGASRIVQAYVTFGQHHVAEVCANFCTDAE